MISEPFSHVETVWLPQAQLSVVNLMCTTNAWPISKYLGKGHRAQDTDTHAYRRTAAEKRPKLL